MDTARTDAPPGLRPLDGVLGDGLVVAVAPRFVVRVVVPLVALLSVVSLVVNVLAVRGVLGAEQEEFLTRALGVDQEESIATLFQVLLIAACAAALATVAKVERAAGSRRHVWWTLLSAVFAALVVDEFASVHERLTGPVRDALDLGGALFYAWVVVAVPVVLVLAVLLVPFLRSLPRRTFLLFTAAGALYVCGAVVLEMIGGAVVERGSLSTVPYVLLSTGEEVCEMLGMATFLGAVGDHLRRHAGGGTAAH